MTMLKSSIDRFNTPQTKGYINEIPIEIDISRIFDNMIIIKALRFAPKNAIIGVDIPLNLKVYSIIGRVKDVKMIGKYFQTSIEVDYIPEEMVREIEEIVNKVAY